MSTIVELALGNFLPMEKKNGRFVIVKYPDREVSIVGERITDLFYKKPSVFRKGNLSLVFTTSNGIDSQKITEKKKIDISFDSKDADSLKRFCKQLSNDIEKPIVEF